MPVIVVRDRLAGFRVQKRTSLVKTFGRLLDSDLRSVSKEPNSLCKVDSIIEKERIEI